MTCENCNWSTWMNHKLECRFNPPTVDTDLHYAVFPVVYPDWWCSKDTDDDDCDDALDDLF
jgi:hypothetical protein